MTQLQTFSNATDLDLTQRQSAATYYVLSERAQVIVYDARRWRRAFVERMRQTESLFNGEWSTLQHGPRTSRWSYNVENNPHWGAETLWTGEVLKYRCNCSIIEWLSVLHEERHHEDIRVYRSEYGAEIWMICMQLRALRLRWQHENMLRISYWDRFQNQSNLIIFNETCPFS